MDFRKVITANALTLSVAVAMASPTVYEAESEKLPVGASIGDTAVYMLSMPEWQKFDTLKTIEISGNKFVESATAMEYSITVEETAVYDFVAHFWITEFYVSGNGSISVDGTEITTLPSNTGTNKNKNFIIKGSVKLKKGAHTFTIKAADKAGYDYLSIEKHPSTVYNLNPRPVTPGATESANKLKTFLTENFGKKTISGMMIGDNAFNYHYGATLEDSYLITSCTPADSCEKEDSLTTWKGQEDIRLFKERSGHYPALGGFDFLFATGGHSDEGWFSGYTDNSVRMAKELWNAGGIPAFDWHWKVGTDTVFYSKTKGYHNAACTEGVNDSDPNNTCFNYTKAFKDSSCKEIDETSATYKLMMADVDKISARFLDLQEDGVAAIWRPLHEAAGGWFWWGLAGGECYKALYKMVFNRMVNVNGVKNAIWVWNLERNPSIGYDENAYDSTWYPGTEYVDVIAVDIYNNANDHSSNAKYYNKIVELMGADKIIGLSENGPIPDIDSTFEDESVWSWWMPWYNTWSSGFLNQTSNDVLKKNLDDERVIALDDMPGWANVKADTSGSAVSPGAIFNKPEAIANKITFCILDDNLTLTIPKSGNGFAALYDIHGKLMKNFFQGRIDAGTHSIKLRNIPKGVYFLRAKANDQVLIQTINLK